MADSWAPLEVGIVGGSSCVPTKWSRTHTQRHNEQAGSVFLVIARAFDSGAPAEGQDTATQMPRRCTGAIGLAQEILMFDNVWALGADVDELTVPVT